MNQSNSNILVVSSFGDLRLPSGSLPAKKINAKKKWPAGKFSFVRLSRVDDPEIKRVVVVPVEKLPTFDTVNPIILKSSSGRRFKGEYHFHATHSIDEAGLMSVVADTKRKSIALEAVKV